jgi:hypothetical protein
MTTDCQLLAPDLLQDIVSFCAAASLRVISYLESTQSDINYECNSWLVPSTKVSITQQSVIASIPEHLIDDVMTLLLFVAKTHSVSLKSTSLGNTLSLIVFFLRRPWAGMLLIIFECADTYLFLLY